MATVIHLPPEVDIRRLTNKLHDNEDAMFEIWRRLLTLHASVQRVGGSQPDSWTDDQLEEVADLADLAANHYTDRRKDAS